MLYDINMEFDSDGHCVKEGRPACQIIISVGGRWICTHCKVEFDRVKQEDLIKLRRDAAELAGAKAEQRKERKRWMIERGYRRYLGLPCGPPIEYSVSMIQAIGLLARKCALEKFGRDEGWKLFPEEPEDLTDFVKDADAAGEAEKERE